MPEIEDVNRLARRQAEFLPVEKNLIRLVRVEIEHTHDIIAAAEMIHFQIPDAFVALRRKKVERTDVGGGINSAQQFHALLAQVHQPVARHQSLAGESFQCGPRARLIERERRANQQHVRIAIPNDVVQVVKLQRGPQRHLKTAPAQHDVTAGARTVHDARAFERNAPAAEQIPLRSDGVANGAHRLPIHFRRVASRRVHELARLAVFLDDDGLAVNFEIIVTPAGQIRE